MAEQPLNLQITTFTDPNMIKVPCLSKTTAEDVIITCCKQLNICPVSRHLFALRISKSKIFFAPNECFKNTTEFDLRIRFKPASNSRLRKRCAKAYEYYFNQVKYDIMENKVIESLYEHHKNELLGLGMMDMFRVMVEKDIPQDIVLNDYKKYIPKEVTKKHQFFVKKPIHEALSKLRKDKVDVDFIKAQYLDQVDKIAPEYLAEDFMALTEENGRPIQEVTVRVSPDYKSDVCIKIFQSKKEVCVLCTIEELCVISIRKDVTVEISRNNGRLSYLKFKDTLTMLSFVSLLDGYYRLMCKWTFNLCKDVTTPSLQRLYTMKCHGPVGGEFSYRKLEGKRKNVPGCFILRESDTTYNSFFIDVCSKDGKQIKTYKLERLPSDEFIFNDDSTKYKNIVYLRQAYDNPDGTIFLKEPLPPSEYDESQLLLCKKNTVAGDSLTDTSNAQDLLPKMPVCINIKDLQVYKDSKKESQSGLKIVYRGMWKFAEGKKVEMAMKILKQEKCDEYLKEFMELRGQWAFLQSHSIVKFYGVTLRSPLSMVMEYLELGNLDEYLRTRKKDIQVVDLIEASSNLASALLHLEENCISHGKIRCRKLMVSCHDENVFTVKLADPGIFRSYSSDEVHWIPVECYGNLEYARYSAAADVWAFATTLWEIFMYGEKIQNFLTNLKDHNEAMKFYKTNKRLRKPEDCPKEIYDLMMDCWKSNPNGRKRPREIVRDIKQMLYQVYNSRRTHSYAKIFPKSKFSIGESISNLSLKSGNTEDTYLGSMDIMDKEEPVVASSLNDSSTNLISLSSGFSGRELHETWPNDDEYSDSELNDLNRFTMQFSTASTSLNSINSINQSINSIQTIFELDKDCNVVLQGKIGQGFYGEVYKGSLEQKNDPNAPLLQVAVKKLKTNAMDSELQDFEREIAIMKRLVHPNIVKILGVKQDPEILLVMEYVPHGSLQSYLKIYRERLNTKELLKFALDIATGMDYLDHEHIVHRDLAARNILVMDHNHVKISDFGLAQYMDSKEYYILKTNREMPIKWYSPESLRDGRFSTKSDVWSYGVTLCEMFAFGEELNLPNMESKKTCGVEQQAFLDALETGLRFPRPAKCPHNVYVRMIIPCWDKDSHNRPNFKTLCGEAEDLLKQYTN